MPSKIYERIRAAELLRAKQLELKLRGADRKSSSAATEHLEQFLREDTLDRIIRKEAANDLKQFLKEREEGETQF